MSRTLLVLIILIVAFAFLWPDSANGQMATQEEPLQVSILEQQDRTGDTLPNLTVLQCNCVTEQDHIRVYDGSDDMVWTDDWSLAIDTDNDIWVIDISADGRVELILSFATEPDQQTALLFDDANGDGYVAVNEESVSPEILEPGGWAARVAAVPGWFRNDGRMAQNVTFWHRPVERDAAAPGGWARVPGAEWQLSDENADGIAEYFSKGYRPEVPREHRGEDMKVSVNIKQTESMPASGTLLWPYLNFRPLPATGDERIRSRFFDHPPELQVDWVAARIGRFILDGYPIGAGYNLNQVRGGAEVVMEPDRINEPMGEIPMAWYDLANNDDDYPELFIRIASFPKGDPYLKRIDLPKVADHDWQSVRYSWNLFNPGTLVWDYKVDLAGRHPIEEIVQYGDLNIRHVPYETLPEWVISRGWDLRALIARETGMLASSEGIYEWSAFSGPQPLNNPQTALAHLFLAQQYILGLSDESPTEYFDAASLPVGYRGEYNFSTSGDSTLYVSTIDNRLHLKGATQGYANLGADGYLEYLDLNADGYFDAWRLWRGGELQEQLHLFEPYLLYARPDQVKVKEVAVSPVMFETRPPRTHLEWREMVGAVTSPEANVLVEHLDSMFEKVSGTKWQVESATIQQFRVIEGGFRFVLHLYPDFAVDGVGLPELRHLEPGAYVTRYDDGFSLEPLTPPKITLSAHLMALQTTTAGLEVPLYIKAVNSGGEDAYGTQLVVEGRNANGSQNLERETVNLLADVPVRRLYQWHPLSAGEWEIVVKLEDREGKVIAEGQPQSLTVTGPPYSIGNGFPSLQRNFNLHVAAAILVATSILVSTLVLLIMKYASRSLED